MSGCSKSVLIVTDDVDARDAMQACLRASDYAPVAASPANVMDAIRSHDPILVSIDLTSSPDEGVAMLKSIRQFSKVPVITCLGKGLDLDFAGLLDVGADAYMTKPLNIREWFARIRALARRVRLSPEEAESVAEQPAFGGWKIDPGRRQITTPSGGICNLTATEYLVFEGLFNNANRLLTRSQILDLIHGPGWNAHDRLIDNQIGRLRRKLAVASQSVPIRTVRGEGYMFASEA